MSFSAIRENKNLAKISRFTVHVLMKGQILRLVPKVIFRHRTESPCRDKTSWAFDMAYSCSHRAIRVLLHAILPLRLFQFTFYCRTNGFARRS